MKRVLAAALGLAYTLLPIASPATPSPLPGPLVSAAWLKDNLDSVVVLDVRDDLAAYAAQPLFSVAKDGKKALSKTGGHIPDALSVDFSAVRQDRLEHGVALKAMMPTADFFANVMEQDGLDHGKVIVIAPTGENVETLDEAARLYFELRYFGQEDVAILNGGTNAWIDAGFPIASTAAPAARGNWTPSGENGNLLVSMEQVQQSLRAGNAQFVDARSTDQYLGITRKAPLVLVGGHLPGARSFPTNALSRPVGSASEFMSADAYTAIFKEQGIDAKKRTVTYCNTGHLAAGAWFVIHEILGNKDAQLYPGSMQEWTNMKNAVVGVPN